MLQRPIIISLVSIFSFGGCTCIKKQEKRPNILFIMADDHTSQAWGIYGGILKDHVKAPNISRLADEGCVLNNCLVSNSICVPSRATILTGQYSHKNGVKTLKSAQNPEANNIAKVLQRGGYQTSMIGKWHLKKEPSGFDYYCVLPGQGRYNNPIMKTKENWEDYHDGGKEYKGFSTDIIADMTIDWIENRDDSKPFMAMCHFKATHEPFDYPDRLKDLYKDIEIPVPASFYDKGAATTGRSFKGQSMDVLTSRYVDATEHPENRTGHTLYPGLPFSVDEISDDAAKYKTYQKFIKDFLRCGAVIDENIGKLLAYLDASGLAENTIVIYTADQGYFLGEHGWFDKRMIYEESAHMPFVIRYPKEIPAGSRRDELVENVDFSALFADYAGLNYPETMQGRSFRSVLLGNTPEDWRDYSYYHYWENEAKRPAHIGIRGKRYKLAFYYGKGLLNATEKAKLENDIYWELFDLEADPNELHNAYHDTQYQEIIKQMKLELVKKQRELGDLFSESGEVHNVFDSYWD